MMTYLFLISLVLVGAAKWLNFTHDSKAQEAHDARMEELRRARDGEAPDLGPDILDERHL